MPLILSTYDFVTKRNNTFFYIMLDYVGILKYSLYVLQFWDYGSLFKVLKPHIILL